MARRHIHSESTSRLAIWARRIAGFAFLASILAIIIVRSGLLEIWPALATFAGALAIAVLALLVAFAAFVVIWMEGLAGMGAALSAMGISLALLAYPAYLGYRAYKLPWIYDITTDPIDPPRYEALARLRPRDANPIAYAGLYAAEQQRAAYPDIEPPDEDATPIASDPPRYEALARLRPRDANPIAYAGLYAAEQQRAAYPDIEPLDEDATPEIAFKAALAVITKRKWIIIDRRPPQPSRPEGHIEAVARTLIMGLRDDVVIRVRGGPDGSRIDVRSSSRFGSFDFGSNATRVRGLIDDIDTAIGNVKPEPALLPVTN